VTKKQRTSEALVVAALELFDERGYEATTVAAIAERARVTEMTFFRHFPSKASVLIDDPYDPLIADAIRRQPASARPLAAAANGVAEAWRAVPGPAAEAVRERLRIVARTPSLHGALSRSSAITESAIAGALTELGWSTSESRIAAAATVAALNAALLDWAEGNETDLGIAIQAAVRILGSSR
jgi:AcrR family transcriptional regulator